MGYLEDLEVEVDFKLAKQGDMSMMEFLRSEIQKLKKENEPVQNEETNPPEGNLSFFLLLTKLEEVPSSSGASKPIAKVAMEKPLGKFTISIHIYLQSFFTGFSQSKIFGEVLLFPT